MARRRTLLAWTTLAALAWCPALNAQPPGREPPAREPPALQPTIESIRAAYRSSPIAERIVVRVRAPGSPERRASVLLRAALGGNKPAGSVRLELGSLLVSATPTRLLAIHRQEPATCFVAEPLPSGPEDAATLIRRHLPPTPLPQLALADPDLDLYPPFLGIARWDRIATPEPRTLRLSGTAPRSDGAASPVVATFDRRTHRLRSMSFSPAEGLDVELTVAPIEPGDPSAWTISQGDRRAVPTLAQLVTDRTSTAPGDRLPPISALTHTLQPWTPRDSFREPQGERPVGVLLLFRASQDVAASPARDDVIAAQRALAGLAHDPPTPGQAPPGFVKAIAVFGPDKLDLEDLPRQARAWGEGTDPPADAPLWLIDALPLFDSLAPQAQAVLVVVDPAQRLVASLPLDGLAHDPDPSARVRGALPRGR